MIEIPPWARSYRQEPLPDPAPGKRYVAIFERDGAFFRMPAGRPALRVDEVKHGDQWVPYKGDRIKPAMFGDFVRFEEVDI